MGRTTAQLPYLRYLDIIDLVAVFYALAAILYIEAFLEKTAFPVGVI